MNLEEKIIKREPKYHGSIIDVEKQIVKLPNGQESSRDIVYHAKAVAALVITGDNKMLMETQWRAPVQEVTLEIPAGKVDSRDTGSSKDAMVRELNEEVRYRAKTLKHLTGFYTSVGFSDEYMDLYLATDLEPVSDELPRDKGEYLGIKAYSLSEAKHLLDSGKIKDAKTAMAILYWELLSK
ncbi:NUDIX hydrolase [Nicoliella spurrieriana]|uniref:NUDIX hydrolase n=1 Tax=Nicoliella spurrieriana TaxID=2925830 RepID=A0A976RTU8_9LACO|nr:NUDIX hydrolase [Nicoliella spurrieriana]UQS87504.1 NUDIX hydrolase [Nicoliella spurrieriana]